ncbi:MAG: 3-hydroxyacyl-ACP dehydratase FabZ [Hyphomicrobiales bacterium]|nr:3-hydroxyacyl-ACP dehydratase FabZ [Hyphomicrobiales bacterium]MCY4048015.1 3-hydroxyacyl-ACP dehydratase FabZ [Hyphomicrobiales bacterium]MCY4052279.1 3-hydroxyacyl-ACP dehydratase FabZ [Hyphomicrobiales bacterium]
MDTQASGESLDLADIMRLLPHRYPFLMIERVENIVGSESAVGIKNVSINEPFFQGHFPERPVLPGVLIVEAIAQTAGAVAAHRANIPDPMTYMVAIDGARFRRPVLPGDRLCLHVEKIGMRRNIWRFSGEAKVNDVLVAEAECSALLAAATDD